MPKTLIIKRGAAGDVLRTTVLFNIFDPLDTTWLVASENSDLLLDSGAKVATSLHDIQSGHVFDIIVSLDDDAEVLGTILSRVSAPRIIGARLAPDGTIVYGPEMNDWFDMSIVSRHGRAFADTLKLKNRFSYQQHLFRAFGCEFRSEPYHLPTRLPASELAGDIAVAPSAGARWPMKNWALVEACMAHFAARYRVNILPTRATLLDHIADVANHRLVVSGDSLPMHLAMGLGKPCVAFFTCTSPWEIHDYGLLEKVISPRLADFFYRRDYDHAGAAAIPLGEGIAAIERVLSRGAAR